MSVFSWKDCMSTVKNEKDFSSRRKKGMVAVRLEVYDVYL